MTQREARSADLSALYALCKARRFRQKWDPAYYVPNQPAEDKKWLAIWPCARGGKGAHLYIHGPGHFAFFGSNSGSGIRNELLAIPDVKSHQTGDREFSVVFPLSLLDAVSAVVRPKKKPGKTGPPAHDKAFRTRDRGLGKERAATKSADPAISADPATKGADRSLWGAARSHEVQLIQGAQGEQLTQGEQGNEW